MKRITKTKSAASEADRPVVMSRLGWAARHGAAYQGIPYHDEIFASGVAITFYVPNNLAVCADEKDKQIKAAMDEARSARELLSIELMEVPNEWLEDTLWLDDSLGHSIAQLADRVGVDERTIRGLYFHHLVETVHGDTPDGRAAAAVKADKLLAMPLNEQATQALVEGVDADQIAEAIWGNDKTWAEVKQSYSRSDDEVLAIWKQAGFEIISTGGGFSAAMNVYQGVEFWLTDYEQTDNPNPDFKLTIGAYVPNSGQWLEFNQEVEDLQDALEQIPRWAEQLQGALTAALEPAPASRPSRGPSN